MSENDARLIKLWLTPEEEKECDVIQEYHAIKSYAGLVRFLIRKEARQIQEMPPLFAPVEAVAQ